jgi:hypothetical protein
VSEVSYGDKSITREANHGRQLVVKINLLTLARTLLAHICQPLLVVIMMNPILNVEKLPVM